MPRNSSNIGCLKPKRQVHLFGFVHRIFLIDLQNGGTKIASIKKLSERKYKITMSNGYRPNGTKICRAKTVDIPKSVRKSGIEQYVFHRAEELEREFKLGYSENAEMKFEEYAQHWLARQVRLARSTRQGYESYLKRMYSIIGHIKVGQIKPITIEYLRDELLKREYRGKRIKEVTVKKYLNVVSAIFTDVKKNGILPYNPVSLIDFQPTDGAVQIIPSIEEARKLIKILEKEPLVYKTYYMLAMYTGCRRGELCALNWEDTRETGVCISKSRGYIKGEGVVDGDTKNKKTRIIFADEWVYQLLKALYLEKYSGRANEFCGEGKIFTDEKDIPIHPDMFTKYFRRIMDNNGFDKRYHLHSLRHFFTSYQLQNNVSKQIVADIVGHADTSFLEKTYYKSDIQYKEISATVMSSFLYSAGK